MAYRDGSGAIQVKTLVGPTWVDLSPPVTASGRSPALGFDQANNLFIAFADDTSSPVTGRLTVEKWTGSAWSPVGGLASPDSVDFLSLGFFGPDIFVASEDYGWGNQGSVFFWNGSTWSSLGSRGFTGTSVYDVSLAVDLYGDPWVAFQDASAGHKATVMEYTGGAWRLVGKRGLSAGAASGVHLAISRWGTPYVAYSDHSRGDAASVMLFRGGSWTTVGKLGFSPGATAYMSLAIGPDGTAAVAFKDLANGSSMTVMQFH